MSREEERLRYAAALDAQAAQTGDPRYRRAAAELRKKPRGRPPAPDAMHLLRMQIILDAGDAADDGDAARIVARDMPGCAEQFRTRWTRLLDKYRHERMRENKAHLTVLRTPADFDQG